MSEFNIKKQIKILYTTGVLRNLSITGAWVALLSVRGFSLWQIGIAETVFHITILIFEIPSGVLADVYGRKKMLLISNIMAAIGDVIMIFSTNLPTVCLSIAFHALCYNFTSGSGDANSLMAPRQLLMDSSIAPASAPSPPSALAAAFSLVS